MQRLTNLEYFLFRLILMQKKVYFKIFNCIIFPTNSKVIEPKYLVEDYHYIIF